MSFFEIPFEEMKQQMIDEIGKHEWAYLATSDANKIRVGKMRLVSDGLRLWCFTRPVTRKYKQIMVNPKVAFADGNLQVMIWRIPALPIRVLLNFLLEIVEELSPKRSLQQAVQRLSPAFSSSL